MAGRSEHSDVVGSTDDDDATLAQLTGVRPTGLSNLSRRQLIQGFGATGIGVAAASLLAACGEGAPAAVGGQLPGTLTPTGQLIVSNWPAYMDIVKVGDTKTRPTLDTFAKDNHVQVSYNVDVNDNAEFYSKIRPLLAAGKPTGRDIIVLTDWMAAKLIRTGWIQPYDRELVPNAKNLIAPLASPSWDPQRRYSLPWQSGITGIATNTGVFPSEVTTMTQLLTDRRLKGRVTVLTEMRDTMGLLLLEQGSNPSKFTNDEWNSALVPLQRAVDAGQIRAFTGNNYLDGLASGEIMACVGWSGDVIQAQFNDPKVVFRIPDAGAMLWADNMMIPNGAQNLLNAYRWMNYYYDPRVAAELAAWVNYICPVAGAERAMASIDKSLVGNPLIFPTKADYKKLVIFQGLSDEQDANYSQQFLDVQRG